MKTCTRCNKEKPLEQFHKNRNHKDGRTTICATCIKISRLDQLRAGPKKKATEAWADNIINQLSGSDY